MADARSIKPLSVLSLHIYPVKSCAGLSVERAQLTSAGFEHDRQWMIVQAGGRFVTQREQPRLALIQPQLSEAGLTLHAPKMDPLHLRRSNGGERLAVQCWGDRCSAFDEGERAARWLTEFLGAPHRLVRFDPTFERHSDPKWTRGNDALNRFSDGFPWLVMSQASLDALNAKLDVPVPMNRFRPNIVVASLEPFEEDELESLATDTLALRLVKPCTRCIITTTDQRTGVRDPHEPLRTLRSFRFDPTLRGAKFGQNAILLHGAGEWLKAGQALRGEPRAR